MFACVWFTDTTFCSRVHTCTPTCTTAQLCQASSILCKTLRRNKTLQSLMFDCHALSLESLAELLETNQTLRRLAVRVPLADE